MEFACRLADARRVVQRLRGNAEEASREEAFTALAAGTARCSVPYELYAYCPVQTGLARLQLAVAGAPSDVPPRTRAYAGRSTIAVREDVVPSMGPYGPSAERVQSFARTCIHPSLAIDAAVLGSSVALSAPARSEGSSHASGSASWRAFLGGNEEEEDVSGSSTRSSSEWQPAPLSAVGSPSVRVHYDALGQTAAAEHAEAGASAGRKAAYSARSVGLLAGLSGLRYGLQMLEQRRQQGNAALGREPAAAMAGPAPAGTALWQSPYPQYTNSYR